MLHKPFNREWYDSSDRAKFVVSYKLCKMGYFVNFAEDYKSDVKTWHPEKKYGLHEVEHRQVWENDWPFETIHIPERKTRLLDTPHTLLYWVVNKEFTKALVCNAKDSMLKERLKEIPNNVFAGGEYFYDVPILEFKELDL